MITLLSRYRIKANCWKGINCPSSLFPFLEKATSSRYIRLMIQMMQMQSKERYQIF